ncbi:MAG: alpha/beta hydrolase [Deltaproteobacteria bacterium]|nr:alpha/beta hydrolase [Deltaproteobacteria bacterium]
MSDKHGVKGGIEYDAIRTKMQTGPFRLNIYDYRTTTDAPPETVFYYFHGQGGDESSYERAMLFLHEYIRDKAPSSVVVSFSAGPEAMLIPKNSAQSSGLVAAFINDVLMKLDQTHHFSASKKILIGTSMGGTSLSYVFFNHPQYFHGAVIISAGHYPFSVFAKDVELEKFIKENETFTLREQLGRLVGVTPRLKGIKSVLSVQKRFFGSESDWENVFIFNTMKKADKRQPVYISIGKWDSLGLYRGNLMLSQKAKAAGYDVTYDEINGGHGAFDKSRVIQFVASLLEK